MDKQDVSHKQKALIWLGMVLNTDGTDSRSKRSMTEEAIKEIKLIDD